MTATSTDRTTDDTAATNTTGHTSRASGLHWQPVDTVYYDCHVVSLAQLLPEAMLGAFLITTGAPRLSVNWGGLSCRNLLDSEPARDVVLLDEFGVEKHHLPIDGDVEATVRGSVTEHGHAVARVDSYYHEHFSEYYLSEHRTNGHKVTVIDFDDEAYYGIDNVGIQTLVLRFDRQLFLESMRSNMFHVYDKHDSLYRLEVGEEARRRMCDGVVRARETAALEEFLTGRADVVDVTTKYADAFAADLRGTQIRRYAQLANSYHTALMIERAYTAVLEGHLRSTESWGMFPDQGAEFALRLRQAGRAWTLFKMLCRAAQLGSGASDVVLDNALNRVVDAERAVQCVPRSEGPT